jgi:methyl-accepting chemotaxis protein
LSLAAFLLYLRRATVGLENHLKPLTFGFFFIFLYELFSLSKIFENTTTISIYNIVRPFGSLWILAHLFLLIGVAIIAKWVFQYLLKRLQTEIFMIFNISILVIFLITTVSFTGLLLVNLKDNALSHLVTDANVVQYAISSKQSETLSDAEVVSQNMQLQTAISTNDKATLKTLSTSILLAKKQSFLIIVASSGAVLMRGEDNEKIGDSLSNDPLFIRAIRGEKASSVTTKDGPIAPVVSIRSSVPITNTGQTIGVVIVGSDIDNAFVDGLKATTKLDVSVYADNVLSATTFIATDGKSRYIGVKEEDKNVSKTVLIDGKNYSGDLNILNVPYFAAFTPLKDVDGNPVGMLFAGEQQVSIIQAASSSIEYTFILAVLFLLISILPSFLISKFITNQFK